MKFGRTLARVLIGGLFVGHGTQKLFGWFGGHGPEGTGQFFESALGLAPGKRNAQAAGWAETAGGALLAAGIATPAAGAALIGTMITAVRTAHLKNGPWVTDGGWEYNAVLIATITALVDEEQGAAAALAALGAGVAGSELILRQAKAHPTPAPAEGAREESPIADPAAASSTIASA
jgi:putative oxidoreductase